MEDWIKVNEFTQVKVDEYNGKLSILQGNHGQNDVVYPKYCAIQIWKNGKKQVLKKNGEVVYVPWAVSLGDGKAKAIKILKAIIWQVEQL